MPKNNKNKSILLKLYDAIWELDNAYDVKDIYNVVNDLKRIAKELEDKK